MPEDPQNLSLSPSPSPEPPPAQCPSYQQEFSLQLIYWVPGTKKGQGKKEVHRKELFFTCTHANYLDFLKAILECYNETKYQVTTRQHYLFKYYYPGRLFAFIICNHLYSMLTISHRKLEAIDINWEQEYCGMVDKICDGAFKKVNIIIDINEIKNQCPVANDDEISDGNEDGIEMSDLDRNLA